MGRGCDLEDTVQPLQKHWALLVGSLTAPEEPRSEAVSKGHPLRLHLHARIGVIMLIRAIEVNWSNQHSEALEGAVEGIQQQHG